MPGDATQAAEEPAGLSGHGFCSVKLVTDDQVPLLLQGPLGEGRPPDAVVVDNDYRRNAPGLGELDLALGLRLLGTDAGKRIIERDNLERSRGVRRELRLPDLDHPQRADDEEQLKTLFGAEVDGHGGFPGAHGRGDHGATLAASKEVTDEGHGFTLVIPGGGSECRDHAGCNSRAKAAASATVNVDFPPTTATTRCRRIPMWWRRR